MSDEDSVGVSKPGEGGRGGTGGAPELALNCETPRTSPTPLRRLTRSEFENSVMDLFNVDAKAFEEGRLQADPRPFGFEWTAGEAVTSSYMNGLLEAAESVSAAVSNKAAVLVGCSLAANDDLTCARPFLRSTLRRAFRRSVTDADFDVFWSVFNDERAASDEPSALRAVIEQILQSPEFLYVVETGNSAETSEAGLTKVQGTVLATRLALLLWRSLPDDELLAAADKGLLNEHKTMQEQIARLLRDPKSRRSTNDFLRQWMELDETRAVRKDVSEAAWFDDQSGSRFADHALTWFDDLAWRKAGGVKEFLLGPLPSFVPAIPEASGAPPRAGVLMHPAFLARAARANASAPVKRGIFVLQKLLCSTPAPPMDAAVAVAPPLEEGRTTREVFEQHLSRPACAGCHAAFDPFGMALEAYDGLGLWRAQDNGLRVNTKARIEIDGDERDVDGAEELANVLATSPMVKECFVKQWFRFALGRAETSADACTLAALSSAFDKGGVLALIEATAASDAIFYRAEGLP